MSIRVGIAGIGRITHDAHYPSLKKLPEFELVSAYDTTEARRQVAARDYGLKVFSDYDQFLNSGIDLVVIATPSDSHCTLAVRAARSKKHLVVEKPMARNLREADQIIQAAKKAGVVLTVHQSRRWDRDFLTVKRILEEGTLGRIFSIESRVASYGNLLKYAVQEFDPMWRYKKRYAGGVIYDYGTHLFDQLLLLVREKPVSVFCETRAVQWSKEVEDYFKAIVRFESGLSALVEVSQVSRYAPPRWYILGERGTLASENGAWPTRLKIKHGEPEGEGQEHFPIMEEDRWEEFYRNLALALTDGARLAVQPDEVRRVTALVDTAYKSAASGKVEKVSA